MIRTCLATGHKLPQNKLLRIGLLDSEVKFDYNKRFTGRGAYIIPTIGNLEKAIQNRGISRVLKINRGLSEAEVENLRSDLKKFLNGSS
jgi:predicted RNA-binding protein YlxR (DUF448 family)